VGIALAFVVAGIAVYQVVVIHAVDHYVIAAVVVLALAFAGQIGDRFLDRFDKWSDR
jgi:uncharacterized protein with GYD domain